MVIILWLSNILFLRKYFLSVEIDYPNEFIDNWKDIKNKSSQDRERNFTVYQLVKLHNKIFEGKQTNVIEFGTDRGVVDNYFKIRKKIQMFIQSIVSDYMLMRLSKMFQNMMNIIMENINHSQKKQDLKILVI